MGKPPGQPPGPGLPRTSAGSRPKRCLATRGTSRNLPGYAPLGGTTAQALSQRLHRRVKMEEQQASREYPAAPGQFGVSLVKTINTATMSRSSCFSYRQDPLNRVTGTIGKQGQAYLALCSSVHVAAVETAA